MADTGQNSGRRADPSSSGLPREAMQAGLRAVLERPRLVGGLAAIGLLQDLLLAGALAGVLGRLLGPDAVLDEHGLGRAARLALLGVLAEHPDRAAAGLGLILVALLLGRLLGSFGLAGALGGLLAGRRGPALVETAIGRGPSLFLLGCLDSLLLLFGLVVAGLAAVSGLVIGYGVGQVGGALAFAIVFGPSLALLSVGWLMLRVTVLAVALGHPVGASLYEGSRFVTRHLAPVVWLGARLALGSLPVLLLAVLLSSMASLAGRAAGVVSVSILATVRAALGLWAYAALANLGRVLAEGEPDAERSSGDRLTGGDAPAEPSPAV